LPMRHCTHASTHPSTVVRTTVNVVEMLCCAHRVPPRTRLARAKRGPAWGCSRGLWIGPPAPAWRLQSCSAGRRGYVSVAHVYACVHLPTESSRQGRTCCTSAFRTVPLPSKTARTSSLLLVVMWAPCGPHTCTQPLPTACPRAPPRHPGPHGQESGRPTHACIFRARACRPDLSGGVSRRAKTGTRRNEHAPSPGEG